MRTETKYNKIVNFDKETNEITMLDYIFNHNDGTFKGATGTKFEPVTKSEYKERMQKDNVIEYLVDSGIELPEYYKRGEFNSLYKAMKQNNELESFIFDTSYNELWDKIRTELNLTKNEAYIFNCVGGGRCFDKDFEGNINTELSEIIRNIES